MDEPPNSADELVEQLRRGDDDGLRHRRVVAQGGAGSIHAFEDIHLRRQVAVKVLHPHLAGDDGLVSRFIREAQITAQLDHPGVVPMHGLAWNEVAGLHFSMKLVQGRTLAELVGELPPGPAARHDLEALLEVVLKVCDALAFAHSRGVLHCDVKPQNVLVGEYGQVYLMDWGIAALVPPADASARRVSAIPVERSPDELAGTPSCMSPEQAHNRGIDARTDVFLVGALLYHIVARHPPYNAPGVVMRLVQAAQAKAPPIAEVAPWVPPALARLIGRAMAVDPDERYPGIGPLREDLVRVARGEVEFPRRLVPAGTAVVREGEMGATAYIIEAGRCRVEKELDGRSVLLREMGPGEMFGEMAVLSAAPRSATVLAVEDTRVLEVSRELFDRELGGVERWMAEFVRTLARRFKEREEEGFAAAAPLRGANLANQALMYLRTWGRLEGLGGPSLPESVLLAQLCRDLNMDPHGVRSALEAQPELLLLGGDVVLLDAEGMAGRLARELSLHDRS